jgi:sRNA-binding carbon storage regulator CsrA
MLTLTRRVGESIRVFPLSLESSIDRSVISPNTVFRPEFGEIRLKVVQLLSTNQCRVNISSPGRVSTRESIRASTDYSLLNTTKHWDQIKSTGYLTLTFSYDKKLYLSSIIPFSPNPVEYNDSEVVFTFFKHTRNSIQVGTEADNGIRIIREELLSRLKLAPATSKSLAQE